MSGRVIGIGLDLCEIERIARAIERAHFFARIFTECERAHITSRGACSAQTAAGLFAAKEAAAKALGTGFTGFGPADIEVYADQSGAPRCRLTGAALEIMRALGGENILLSITHTDTTAAAVAVMTD